MDVFNNTEIQPREEKDEIFEMGMQFAFEGLTEEDFRANNEEELISFRNGFKAGMAMQPQSSIPTEEFKGMSR